MSEPIIMGAQLTWPKTFDECGYSVASLAKLSGIDESSFRKYLNLERAPRKTNYSKMEKAMSIAGQTPRLKYHPSYGYATEAQIEKLKTLGVGHEMDAVLKQIAEQTRNRGKFK